MGTDMGKDLKVSLWLTLLDMTANKQRQQPHHISITIRHHCGLATFQLHAGLLCQTQWQGLDNDQVVSRRQTQSM